MRRIATVQIKLQASVFAMIAAILATSIASGQMPAANVSSRPAFDAATIKPSDLNKGGAIGFYSYPGGRVHMGFSSVKLLLYFAYGVKDFQISGGPDWIATDRYDIEAVPPETSPSRAQKIAPFKIAPTDEQRQMLQSLLADRFAFKSHMETREGLVYVLTRGSGKLLLDPPKDADMDWRGTVMNKGGIWDGEAFGSNISMATLAGVLTGLMGQTVVDQTGIEGKYDFHLPPVDPQNTDREAAVFDAVRRLGLNLKRGKGAVQTLVIDHVERPTEN
jgi:uncharacterized protein (TIGR03435 family)